MDTRHSPTHVVAKLPARRSGDWQTAATTSSTGEAASSINTMLCYN